MSHYIDIKVNSAHSFLIAQQAVHYAMHDNNNARKAHIKNHDVAIQYRVGSAPLRKDFDGVNMIDGLFIRILGTKEAVESITGSKDKKVIKAFARDDITHTEALIAPKGVEMKTVVGRMVSGDSISTINNRVKGMFVVAMITHTGVKKGTQSLYFRQYRLEMGVKACKGSFDANGQSRTGTSVSFK